MKRKVVQQRNTNLQKLRLSLSISIPVAVQCVRGQLRFHWGKCGRHLEATREKVCVTLKVVCYPFHSLHLCYCCRLSLVGIGRQMPMLIKHLVSLCHGSGLAWDCSPLGVSFLRLSLDTAMCCEFNLVLQLSQKKKKKLL